MTVRTRFAPSPTGFMHIGNLRTGLYAYLFARHNGGKFVLRIEDTDRERHVEGAEDMVYRTLRTAGIDYDEGLGALTAIFGGAGQAQECAKRSLDRFDDAGQRVMAAVFTEPVEFGVFGSKRMLYPLAVSGALHRRQEVLSLLLEFGAVLVQSGEADYSSLRLLGWDGEIPYYEDPSCRSSAWQAQWENAETLWAEAMSLFRSQQFPQAMRRFARVLRLVPEDAAARWYLFRCESLRDTAPSKKLDTGLLFDWGRRHG